MNWWFVLAVIAALLLLLFAFALAKAAGDTDRKDGRK